jgi:hypothetical protein
MMTNCYHSEYYRVLRQSSCYGQRTFERIRYATQSIRRPRYGRSCSRATPTNFFLDSQFRAMCNKAGLSRADIVKIRAGADAQLLNALESPAS